MNSAEHELDFPWTSAPEPGAAVMLRPGLYWLRMPLPFALNHINLWLLEDEIEARCGWTAIDCGIADDPTRQAWHKLFEGAFGGRPLLRVIATHFHPDHLGLAEWLSHGGDGARWHAPVWMTAAEYMVARLLTTAAGSSLHSDLAPQRRFYEEHGVDGDEALLRAQSRGERRYARMVPAVPPTFRRIFDGESIRIGAKRQARQFRVITGFGHAPEHASLMCDDERILISGDMVLPSISTNISVYDIEPEADPLSQYLDSIDRLAALPADTLVLPSHGLPFLGLHARVAQLHAHHRERLDETLQACGTPRTADQLMPLLFRRPLDRHQVTFAFGETLAHLHRLWYGGLLERQRGADGIYRFSRV
ncbi:MAG TPA: MBL fold metallo-hydrolase [Burkholderiaceae bacterium]|nr:MBL fold metallo-hydrolase [Burkholderiaceae bacterium]